jgi:hypothetical protein
MNTFEPVLFFFFFFSWRTSEGEMNAGWFIYGGNHSHLLQKELCRHKKKKHCFEQKLSKKKPPAWCRHGRYLLYPGSMISTHPPNQLYFQKSLVWQMPISTNIPKYPFIFIVKFLFKKILKSWFLFLEFFYAESATWLRYCS